ncbi:MAG: TolC family protein, partial [Candidatus Eremiobacterota bacterium]
MGSTPPRKSIPLCLTLLVMLLGWPARASAEAWSLEACLSRVLAEHPELKAARGRVAAARAWADGAGAQPNPELRLAGTVGTPGEDANSLVQRLEIGGQAGLRGDIAELDVHRAELEALALERSLALRTGSAFYDLWEADQRARVAATRLELARELERVSRRRLEVGEISRNQFLRVELETARAEADLAEAAAAR